MFGRLSFVDLILSRHAVWTATPSGTNVPKKQLREFSLEKPTKTCEKGLSMTGTTINKSVMDYISEKVSKEEIIK